jgi:hypothetical protein
MATNRSVHGPFDNQAAARRSARLIKARAIGTL